MLCKISFLIHLAFYLHYKATITENTRKDAIFSLTKTKPAVKKNLFPENCHLFETDSEDYCTDILFEQFSSPRGASALWFAWPRSIVRLSLLEMSF